MSRVARVAGLLYLIQMATAMFGYYTQSGLAVRGDAAQTAKNILASEQIFRIGIAANLMTTVVVITLIWALYVVLESSNRPGALLALILRLAENCVAAAAIFSQFVALRLLHGGNDLQAFDTRQLQTLSRLFNSVQGLGLEVAFIFCGFGSAVFSYVWLQSRYIPRALAYLGIFASLTLALVTLAIMVFPRWGSIGLTYMAPMFFYEVGLGLWLLIKGIRT